MIREINHSIYFCHNGNVIISTKNKFINGYLMR